MRTLVCRKTPMDGEDALPLRSQLDDRAEICASVRAGQPVPKWRVQPAEAGTLRRRIGAPPQLNGDPLRHRPAVQDAFEEIDLLDPYAGWASKGRQLCRVMRRDTRAHRLIELASFRVATGR